MTEESEIKEVSKKSPLKLLENKFVLATAVFLVCVGVGAPIGFFLSYAEYTSRRADIGGSCKTGGSC